MEILEVQNEAEFNALLEINENVLVDFWAEWCGPCKAMNPVVAQFAEQYKDTQVVKVNCDYQQELAFKYNIRSIPCFVAFIDGKEVARHTGTGSLDQIMDLFGDL